MDPTGPAPAAPALVRLVDGVLARPAATALVHGDLHGHNQVWQHDRPRLRAVVDFETCGIADPEYDFRSLPAEGPGWTYSESGPDDRVSRRS